MVQNSVVWYVMVCCGMQRIVYIVFCAVFKYIRYGAMVCCGMVWCNMLCGVMIWYSMTCYNVVGILYCSMDGMVPLRLVDRI